MTQPRAYFTLHHVADAAAPRFASALRAAIHDSRDAIPIARFRDAVADRNPGAVLHHMDFPALANAWSVTAERIVRDVFHAAAQKTTVQKQATIAEFRFDLTNPRAVSWILTQAGLLIQQISEESRRAIREILARGFDEGITVPKMAQFIRDLIGLDSQSANALANYRAALDASLPPAVAERRVTIYRDRLLRHRSMVIARTETIRAAAAGQHELWRQLKDDDLIDDTARRRWAVTPDERLCPICAPMPHENDLVGLEEPFITGDGRSILHQPAHPQCRCAVFLVFPDEFGEYPPTPEEVNPGSEPTRRLRPALA